MKWSSYQEAIFETYEETKKNIVISAGPGSAKTTCLTELSKRTSPTKKSLFLAFNKSISEELKERLPDRFECATFHSKGLKILFSNFDFKLKVDENKTFKLCKKILDLSEMQFKAQNKYIFDLQLIWDQLRLNLIPCSDIEFIENLCIEKDIEFKERTIEDLNSIEIEWHKQALKINCGQEFSLDFTDMLYLPYLLVEEEKRPKYDIVFVDEYQDLNKLQNELIFSYIKKTGRFVFCGDERQCIYSFMGASVSNFREAQSYKNTITLPLSITYRCAKRIVEEAQTVFAEGIECAPNAAEGEVRIGSLEEVKSGDFVLCRNNLPLIEAFLKCLEQGKKAYVKGKDLGESLCKILDKINEIDELDLLLESKIVTLKEKGYSVYGIKNNPSYVVLEEKCQILKMLYKQYEGTMYQLKEHIQTIFSDDQKEGVMLSTIHKSKGLETDRVFFLNANLIPSDHAKTEEALYAEYCLKFVAITRAKTSLIYIN